MATKEQFFEFLKSKMGDDRLWWTYAIHPKVINAWLEKNSWAADDSQACLYCIQRANVMKRYCERPFSEEVCAENVSRGGTCYRQMLNNVFIPTVEKMLQGIYPPEEELLKRVYEDHHKMGLQPSGTPPNNLYAVLTHELLGMVETMGALQTLPEI